MFNGKEWMSDQEGVVVGLLVYSQRFRERPVEDDYRDTALWGYVLSPAS